MWPWEHLAVGYVVYSLLCRAFGRRPGAAEVLVLVFATQFPDLIDKPLGWGTALLPSGTSLAHSLLFAVPIALVVLLVSARLGRRELGTAFGVGYLLHPPADLFYAVVTGGGLKSPSFLLWPLLPVVSEPPVSVFERVGDLLGAGMTVLTGPSGLSYIMFELTLLVTAIILWVSDGRPGLPLHSRGSGSSKGPTDR